MTTQAAYQAARVADPDHNPDIRRVVIVPDLERLTAVITGRPTDHGYDALLRELNSWTDQSVAPSPWHGLIIVAPHTDADDLMRDENFVTMWSQWSQEHMTNLRVTVFNTETTDGQLFRARNHEMSFSSPGARGRQAYVSILPRNFMTMLEGTTLEAGKPWQAVNTIGLESAWGEVFEHIFGTTLQSSPADPTLPGNWIGGDHLIVMTDRDHDGHQACGEIVILGVDPETNQLIVQAAPVEHAYDPAGHLP